MIKALGCMKRFDFAKEKLTFCLQLGVFVFWLNTQCKPLRENVKGAPYVFKGLLLCKFFFSLEIPQLIMPYAHHSTQKISMDHYILI
jgi:hypothetical protein